jgi:hypothetical protein
LVVLNRRDEDVGPKSDRGCIPFGTALIDCDENNKKQQSMKQVLKRLIMFFHHKLARGYCRHFWDANQI